MTTASGTAASVFVPREPIPAAFSSLPRREPPPDPLFDEFWSVYPRKIGKAHARREWQRKQRRGADFRRIIAAAERFRDECLTSGREPRFIPHPVKWLNGERYDDDAATGESAPPPALQTGPERLNSEQLLAAVIRLTANREHPVTAAAEIIRTVRASLAGCEEFPLVTAERGCELAAMPYPEYLQTPEWRERGRIKREQAAHRCQVCNSTDKLHVHHRTYGRRGVEHPADLIVLCDGCHKLFHDNGKLAAEPAA
jgi:hypothetical protein